MEWPGQVHITCATSPLPLLPAPRPLPPLLPFHHAFPRLYSPTICRHRSRAFRRSFNLLTQPALPLPPSAASNRAPDQPRGLPPQAHDGKGLCLRQHGHRGYSVRKCEQSAVLCGKAGSSHPDDPRGGEGGGGRLGQRGELVEEGWAGCECEQSAVLHFKAGSPHSDDPRGGEGGGGRLGARGEVVKQGCEC